MDKRFRNIYEYCFSSYLILDFLKVLWGIQQLFVHRYNSGEYLSMSIRIWVSYRNYGIIRNIFLEPLRLWIWLETTQVFICQAAQPILKQ